MTSASSLTTTTFTCTISSYANLDYLLVQTTALLCEIQVDYTVVPGADLKLSGTQMHNLSGNASYSATGWTGAVRLLARLHPLLALSPTQDAWLEATHLTLWPIWSQAKKEPVFEGAVLEFVQRLDKHFKATTFLDGTHVTLADVCVAQLLLATLQLLGRADVPDTVATWLRTTLTKMSGVLPHAQIPGWRQFGVQRTDVWKQWAEWIGGGDAAAVAATATPSQETSSKSAPAAAPAAAPAVATSTTGAYAAFTDPENAVLKKLQEVGVPFDAYSHAACMTADELNANVPLENAKDTHTKNLFLRDKKQGHFLVTLHPQSACNTRELAKLMGLPNKTNLRLADAAILDQFLHVQPGCVGPLSLCMADHSNPETKVTLVLDQALLTDVHKIHSHPLRNDASVALTPQDLQTFLQKLGVEPVVLEFGKESEKSSATTKPAAAPAATKPAADKPEKKEKKAATPAAANKKGETKLALQWTKKDNFPEWYSDIIVLSEMISYYDISGCYILRPWAYKQWELIQEWFNVQIHAMGVENSYFPMFVSQSRLEKEKDHVEGFAPEVAWVTRSGDGELAQPIAVRPTSETIMYPAFSDWIKSHRDLPLKLNQWSNVVRWEFKYPTPFLRTREFLWQEGHTAHATFDEADEMVMKALELYRQVYEDLLAVPVVPGYKTEKEKFAGGFRTTTVEAYIAGSGRAIQGATSHNLGQNFGTMFDIKFQNEKGESEIAWQTSWGLTTRTIGVMVMVHGDDTGLVLPPRIAPLQAVIVPIYSKKFTPEQAAPYCEALLKELETAGIRVKYDNRTIYNPGWKYAHWEQKGVPLRIEVGPRDVEQKSVRVVTRHNGDKEDMAIDNLGTTLKNKLDEIQKTMFEKAKTARDSHLVQVTEWKDFVPNLEKNNLVLTPWVGGEHTDWEEKVKELSREESLKARGEDVEDEKTATSVAAKTLCIPFKQPEMPKGTKCIISDQEATCWILWGRSY